MTSSTIKRRLLVHVGGYDPMSPAAAHARFAREARRFESTWGVRAAVSALGLGPDTAAWTVEATGPDWTIRTEILLLRWDDVMEAAARRPAWQRLPLGLVAFGDFVVGGALWRYGRHAWRYALFFLYPFLLLAMLAGAAAGFGLAVARATGWTIVGAGTGLLVLAALAAWAGHRLSLSHLLDDWIFARDYVRRDDALLGPRLDRVADEIVSAWRTGGADEIVVLGHSLGAVLAVDLLDRTLAREPALGEGTTAVALVTVGSSIPKIGLHGGAQRFRAALGRVADAPGLFWVEYQALTDAMNFYKTNPVQLLLGRPTGGPLVRIVRISRMLHRPYYKKIKRDFFRIHNQFVSANDLRAVYDYFMVVCSPISVTEQARSPLGAEAGIARDGSLASSRAPSRTIDATRDRP
ncbi:hypothetical protein [uncultured Enterovirga sp.]|uniref:hypothetical protein n=1 Tax=uncultured Enterovirga sp. TaxID=2026352 RepID=UPI0035C99D26